VRPSAPGGLGIVRELRSSGGSAFRACRYVAILARVVSRCGRSYVIERRKAHAVLDENVDGHDSGHRSGRKCLILMGGDETRSCGWWVERTTRHAGLAMDQLGGGGCLGRRRAEWVAVRTRDLR